MKSKGGVLFGLRQGLQAVGGLKGIKFAYAVAKNLKIVNSELEIIEKLRMPSKEYIKTYDKERLELCEKYCEKDEKDEPKTNVTGYEFTPENRKKFEREVEELKAKHPGVVKEYEDQIEEYNKMIGEEMEIELFMIDQANIPEDITTGQLSGIIQIVKEEKVENAAVSQSPSDDEKTG